MCIFALLYTTVSCCKHKLLRMMDKQEKVKMTVQGITYSHLQQGAYVLVLAEAEGTRRIPIVIGAAEAQSIAIRLEKLAPPRPMTHDLIAAIGDAFEVVYDEVLIHRFDNGIFYSTLRLHQGERIVEIDSRTSDAIAIALRTNMPIYMLRSVVQEAGFEASQLTPSGKEEKPRTLEEMSDAELELRKEQAVAVEAYEEAALIQQILQQRKE